MSVRFFHTKKTQSEIRMTDGSLWKNMLLLSIPLMLSQLLQVLFNMADVAVVGKFSSAEALGAVGSTTILVSLFTGFLIGMGSAVNVRVAQHLGAREKARTSATIRTSFIICLATGCIITVLCLLSARFMLELLGTKEDLIEGAVLYFRIYALGMPALGIFNFGNGVLSANGDTKRPLVYLMIAGLLNVMFNLFFVIVCDMAEDGVALASIITQYVSAVLILIHMGRQTDDCAFRLRDLKDGIDRTEGKRVLGLGIPAGLQNAVFAVANLFIQGAVNSFESVMVEGNSAAANADSIIYNVMAAFYTACSTFMGQNLGAGQTGSRAEELLHRHYIFLCGGRDPRRRAVPVRQRVFVPVHQRRSSCGSGVVADADHVLLLCGQRFHGLHHRRQPRYRQEPCADHHCNYGLLRVPYRVDLYRVRPFSHHPVPVSAVHLFVDDYRDCGNHLLYRQLQKTGNEQNLKSFNLPCPRMGG